MVINPPSLGIKYSCISKIVNLSLDWTGEAHTLPLASMTFDLRLNDANLMWTLETRKIKELKTTLNTNLDDLTGAYKMLGEFDAFFQFK